MQIIIATIQNNDEYCPQYSPEYPQRYCLLKQYAESTTLKSQAQQATTDGHIDLNVTFLINANTM